MKKFELGYDLSEERVLLPQLLQIEEPPFEFDEAGALKFVLHYQDFLPRSIISRFIVKRHQDIKADLRWRTGVVLENRALQATALVRADQEAHRIDIYVTGPQRKDYLAVILLFFREINDSFEKLSVSERVPMPDNPQVTASYKTLLNYARRGLDEYIPDGSDKVYSVKELLGLVQLDDRDHRQAILRILQSLGGGKRTDEQALREAAQRIGDLTRGGATFNFNINQGLSVGNVGRDLSGNMAMRDVKRSSYDDK